MSFSPEDDLQARPTSSRADGSYGDYLRKSLGSTPRHAPQRDSAASALTDEHVIRADEVSCADNCASVLIVDWVASPLAALSAPRRRRNAIRGKGMPWWRHQMAAYYDALDITGPKITYSIHAHIPLNLPKALTNCHAFLIIRMLCSKLRNRLLDRAEYAITGVVGRGKVGTTCDSRVLGGGKMARAEYLSGTRGLTRAIERALMSVRLISGEEQSPFTSPTIEELLDEARRNQLPGTVIFNRSAPDFLRSLALRQRVLLTVIPLGLVAAEVALSLGLFWIMNRFLEEIHVSGFTDPLVEAIMNMILIGGTGLFAKLAGLCWGLAVLCRPLRPMQLIQAEG